QQVLPPDGTLARRVVPAKQEVVKVDEGNPALGGCQRELAVDPAPPPRTQRQHTRARLVCESVACGRGRADRLREDAGERPPQIATGEKHAHVTGWAIQALVACAFPA